MVAAKDHPVEYFAASALAASINYPLWRAAAVGQSGFVVRNMQVASIRLPQVLSTYVYGCLPPYKGLLATVGGMTYARACIFWGSDYGRDALRQAGFGETVSTVAPPLVVSTVVQVINQPIIRATVTLQDPNPERELRNVMAAFRHIYRERGVAGLWHGTTVGLFKTVPKYITAVVVKDYMEEHLPRADPSSPTYEYECLERSAVKSASAGIVGAALTNPLDVIRNEMFKTHHGMTRTVRDLQAEMGWAWMGRGLGKNMVAVAIPIACTIFFTDAFIQMRKKSNHED
eukprot:CAMPEP_0197439812 /NCGR_PEP_ID=MMETSP1175-20131217/6470_1 /TAXON_ID=1003142 /ORGANISM="Triceratium dubium, Strain CCMP147" /LENGTH=286 /DNA_ID=CAMNT_0042969797 /DNA_START=47 /DNA_END=907 /DNA_ORIENTATION=+